MVALGKQEKNPTHNVRLQLKSIQHKLCLGSLRPQTRSFSSYIVLHDGKECHIMQALKTSNQYLKLRKNFSYPTNKSMMSFAHEC